MRNSSVSQPNQMLNGDSGTGRIIYGDVPVGGGFPAVDQNKGAAGFYQVLDD
jgi:hypothetical protein